MISRELEELITELGANFLLGKELLYVNIDGNYVFVSTLAELGDPMVGHHPYMDDEPPFSKAFHELRKYFEDLFDNYIFYRTDLLGSWGLEYIREEPVLYHYIKNNN